MDMHTGQQPNRGAGEDHQLDPQRAHEIRNRLSAITGIPIPAQAASFAIDRDGDAMSTPSPPRAPMFPPGRAPHLPPFGQLPSRGDDFFAHSAVFHPAPNRFHHFEPLMPPNGFARQPTHSSFLHAPPPPPIPEPSQPTSLFNRTTNSFAAFAHAAPHSGITPPPPRRWNDNDNA
jgi:hypothetical protein